jgi:hypothetical protein
MRLYRAFTLRLFMSEAELSNFENHPQRSSQMLLPTRGTRTVLFAVVSAFALASATAGAQSAQVVREPDAGLTVGAVAELYQMLDPRGYADGLTSATYLRLLPDGRSRLEAVLVSDTNGTISARTDVGEFHRSPWTIRRSAASPELCFEVAGKTHCSQVERDLGTADLLLYDATRPRGHADLRLHRVGQSGPRASME